jgi:hypothetical protein
VSSGTQGEPAIYTATGTTVGSSNQDVDISVFTGANWGAKVNAAVTSSQCASGCTLKVPDSEASDGTASTINLGTDSNFVNLVFTGSGIFTSCIINAGTYSHIDLGAATLKLSGSSCIGVNQTNTPTLQVDYKFIVRGGTIDCNGQTGATGIYVGNHAQTQIDWPIIVNCTDPTSTSTTPTGGLVFNGTQFAEVTHLREYNDYVGAKIYSVSMQGGGNQNNFYGAEINTCKVCVLQQALGTLPQGGNHWYDSTIQTATISEMAVLSNSAFASTVQLDGGTFEVTSSGTGTVVIDGATIDQYSLYVNGPGAQVTVENVQNAEASIFQSIGVLNHGNVTIRNPYGFGSSLGFFAQTDTTGTVALSGYANFLGLIEGVTTYPDTILPPLANQDTKFFGTPLETQVTTVPNVFTANPLAPSFADCIGSTSCGTAADPTYGSVGQVVHASSAGNENSNRFRIGNYGTSSATSDWLTSFNIMSNQTCAYQISDYAISNSQTNIILQAGVWYRVVLVEGSITSGTSPDIVGFPQCTTGPTVSVQGVEIAFETTGSIQAQGILGTILHNGAVNPNLATVSLPPVHLESDYVTDGTTNFQVIGYGGGNGILQWSVPSVLNPVKFSFSCNMIYLQNIGNDVISFGIQAVTAAPTAIMGTGVMGYTTNGFTPGTLYNLNTTTATAIVSNAPTGVGGSFPLLLQGTIENPASTANTFNIIVKTATGADTVQVRRGSACTTTILP